MAFLLVFPGAICPQSIVFFIRRTGDMPSEFQLKSFFHGLFTLLEWVHSYFPPHVALSFPLALNTTPLLELCFMRCDGEVWWRRQTMWTGT